MTNQNDLTVQYYDTVYKDIKGADVTNEELKLIKSFVRKDQKILDVACGTGRHLVPLAKSGYNVTGVDFSKGMLNILKKKVKDTSKIIHKDFYKLDSKEKYDLIYLMWNAFNEIALTKKDAKRLIRKLKTLLSKNGKILINIDNPNHLNLPNMNFTLILNDKGKKHRVDWKIKNFKRSTNTTISEEWVRVFKNNKVIFNAKALIKQRWWSLAEIRNIAKDLKLKAITTRLRTNKELYIHLYR